jgi:hypothetical protein
MAFNCGTNVWGNTYRENREKSLGSFRSINNVGESNGPTSLPNLYNQSQNSNVYSFKTSSSSSQSSNSESTHFNWGGSESRNQSSSGSSSNSSSPMGSSSGLDKRLDWGSMVDNVLKEEIGKMAEGLRNGMY